MLEHGDSMLECSERAQCGEWAQLVIIMVPD